MSQGNDCVRFCGCNCCLFDHPVLYCIYQFFMFCFFKHRARAQLIAVQDEEYNASLRADMERVRII